MGRVVGTERGCGEVYGQRATVVGCNDLCRTGLHLILQRLNVVPQPHGLLTADKGQLPEVVHLKG